MTATLRAILAGMLLWCVAVDATAGTILFIGNSFTYGRGSPVLYYRSATVTDLNGQGIGGVPALFKSFTVQAGLTYDVYLETHPGVGLDWHLAHALPVLEGHRWDSVVLQGHSLLDPAKPGDPALLVANVGTLAGIFRAKNAAVELRLTSTWPRADQTYEVGGAWYGQSIEAMAHDLRAGYDAAAAATPGHVSVVGVGDAWVRAMRNQVADRNPYDGIDAGKLDLWTYDHYHASAYGYYLEALMLFGSVTGRDPRSLGATECSGYELGLSMPQVAALQTIAAEQLAADAKVAVAPPPATRSDVPQRCATQTPGP